MYVARILYPVEVLGPGRRVGVWFCGCPRRCPGCSNPELWEPREKYRTTPEHVFALIQRVAARHPIDGFTLTGGDPMAQPEDMQSLIHLLRSISTDILVYTGYHRRELPETLLAGIAVLIDGPYIESRNNDCALRGSDNQTIHILDPAYRDAYDAYCRQGNRIQNFMTGDGVVSVGIHHPGFTFGDCQEEHMADYIAKWHRELAIFSRIKPLIMLEGNVLDSYQYPVEGSTPKGSILRLPDYLHYDFKDMGYENIVFYDSLRGFHNACEDGHLSRFALMTGASVTGDAIRSDFKGCTRPDAAANLTRAALTQSKQATAVVMDFASRYITSPDHMGQLEVDSFTVLLQTALEARDVRTAHHGILKNLLVLIVSKANDLPAWFYLHNPNLKIITLSAPAREEREALVKSANFPSFFAGDVYQQSCGYYADHPDELEKLQDKFIALTEGFSFTEINSLRRLCKNERIAVPDLCDVIDLYKYGIRENPWKRLDLAEIRAARAAFEKRVKGQEHAITKTLDVIKRAITGMSDLQGSSHTRPKGVLFFAGPTGTGKTETAKTLAEIIFGDERLCKRFDMSEYGQSHSDQKLLGAPPGYVGYEAGGQLTNAVKEHPFSILLFDEIEKAHPSILDKFLQILEDGRMTDGQGNTVYFSETIIIFTSNLGIFTMNEHGQREANVTQDMPYQQVAARVREAIERYFKLQLGRPEILNRIGENIVVFDYIRPDVARLILASQVERITRSLEADKHITLTLAPQALDALTAHALSDLSNGGRGVGNVVENLLINPLARYLFDHEIFANACITITALRTDGPSPEVVCQTE